MNAWYDAASNSRILLRHIDLAIAVDTPSGLIVPVLRNIQTKTPDELRAAIAAQQERRARAQHHAGGSARLHADVVEFRHACRPLRHSAGRASRSGDSGRGQGAPGCGGVGDSVAAHRRMPLSLSFDHRCITGGEACRFLAAVIADLEQPE